MDLDSSLYVVVRLQAIKEIASNCIQSDKDIENIAEFCNEINDYISEECEWFEYDYRTLSPRNHDIDNPYWRIPDVPGRLKYCPYCGKKIKIMR